MNSETWYESDCCDFCDVAQIYSIAKSLHKKVIIRKEILGGHEEGHSFYIVSKETDPLNENNFEIWVKGEIPEKCTC